MENFNSILKEWHHSVGLGVSYLSLERGGLVSFMLKMNKKCIVCADQRSAKMKGKTQLSF